MSCHGFVVHHPETLQALLLHIFLNQGKYFSGDYHNTNHNSHNNILEYSYQLHSEDVHHAYLLLQEVHQPITLVLQELVRLETPSHHVNVRIIIWVPHHGDLCSYIYENILLHMNLNNIEYL